MYGARIKGALELHPVFKEVDRLKILNGIKGVVTLGQDPTQLSLFIHLQLNKR